LIVVSPDILPVTDVESVMTAVVGRAGDGGATLPTPQAVSRVMLRINSDELDKKFFFIFVALDLGSCCLTAESEIYCLVRL